MNLKKVPTGINIPDDIYIIVEISANSKPIKYEINKKTGLLFVDRFMPTSMRYPCNYGYINNTLSQDGDPLDALIITPYPLKEGSVILSQPVGMLKMTDESGEDIKIIAVPHKTISNQYEHIKNINDIPDFLKNQITHFFTHYKDLEPNKWVKIDSWKNEKDAKAEIIKSHNNARKKINKVIFNPT